MASKDYSDTRKNISKTMLGNLAETLGFKKGLSYKQLMTEAASLSQKAVRQGLKRAGWKGAAALAALEAVGYGASKVMEGTKSDSKTPSSADPKGLMKPKKNTVEPFKKKVEQPKKKPNIPPKAPPTRPKKAEDMKKKTTQLYMKEKNTGKDSNVKFNSRGGMLKKGRR
jgi:hypothetical protein